MEKITRNLIAPCGMDCGVCLAHLRERNPCPGCMKVDADSPKTRVHCRIRNCRERKGRFCFSCQRFPCDDLERLDNRYRTRYGMSEIENLEYIRENGIDAFVRKERRRWQTPKGVFCVHDRKRYP